jgi:hypothetical protein
MNCPTCGSPLETQPLAVSGVRRHWCPLGSVWAGDTQDALSFVVASSSNCCKRARQNTDAAMANVSSRIICSSESAATSAAA